MAEKLFFSDNNDPVLSKLGEKSLENILAEMVKTIESSKSQIFEVYEAAREEVDEGKKSLEELKEQTRQVISLVDELKKQEQKEKQNLVRVSSSFSDYSEEKIRQAYIAVKDVQLRLEVAQEKEKELKRQRNRLEIRLYHLQKTVLGAERLAMRISSILGFLGSQLSDVVAQMENASKNKFLSAAIIQAQEEERFRVSREIHDGPAQDVANLLFQSSVVERLIDVDPDEAKQTMQELRRNLRSTLADIRQIIFDMRPMSLDDLGLVAAISQLVDKLREREVVKAEFVVEGNEVKLPGHVQTGAFRIVQEALNNVDRHAGTKNAKVRILFTSIALSIIVEDQGEGFDMDEVNAKRSEVQGNGHFGMMGMYERAQIIGAQLNISSTKGMGTRVHLRLPLNPNDPQALAEFKKQGKEEQQTAAAQEPKPAAATGGKPELRLR